MRKITSLVLLLAFTFFSALPVAAGPENLFCSLGRDNQKMRHKSGPEVANKVKDLKLTNKSVRDALAAFEKNERKTKRRPKIDDAVSMSFDLDAPREAVAFLKSSFSGAQSGGGSVEVISVPTYSAPGEWQGTVIAYKYDANGNVLNQYVADVILLPDSEYTYWNAVLEVSYDNEGAWLEEGLWEYYYQLGAPSYEWLASAPALRKPQFQKVQFQPGRIRIVQDPKVKSAVKCAGLGCTGAAIGCAAGSIFFAGAPFAPCLTQGCTGVVGVCVLVQFFGD